MAHMAEQAGPRKVPARSPLADLREFVHENLALAGVQAELGRTYAELGDDHGLEYALRRFAAHAKAALATFADLKARGGQA